MASRRAIKIGGLCFGHHEKGDGVVELYGKRNIEGQWKKFMMMVGVYC